MTTYVVYHDNCLDGLASATLANKYLYGEKINIPLGHVNAREKLKFIDDNVIDKIKETERSTIYVLDYSFSHAICKHILSKRPLVDIVILDHHETSFGEWNNVERAVVSYPMENVCVYFNNHYSGTFLSLIAFTTSIEWLNHLPKDKHDVNLINDISANHNFVKYIQDRDLWKFNFVETKAFCDACFHNVKTIDNMLDRQLDEIQKTSLNEIVINGHLGYCVNANGFFSSELGSRLCRLDAEHQYAIIWQVRVDGVVACSVRSTPEFEFGSDGISKLFGGGGHKCAAGFKLPVNRLPELIGGELNSDI
jgi:phosphoesterase DHHA1